MISWQEIVAKEAVSVCSHQYLLPRVNIGKTTRKVVFGFFFQLCKTRFWQGGMTSHWPLLAAAGLVLSAQTWLWPHFCYGPEKNPPA